MQVPAPLLFLPHHPDRLSRPSIAVCNVLNPRLPMDLAPTLKSLAARQTPSGAFAAREGGEPRPDATAWAVLGMRAAGPGNEEAIEKARQELLTEQFKEGLVAIDHDHPVSSWPTALALLSWWGWPPGEEASRHALNFLSDVTVITFKSEDTVNSVDSTMRGWAWIGGTTCWVEPTSMAVFAFDRCGRQIDRVRQGINLVLNRQLPHGGWNFGNTFVYGAELLPAEEYIGVALTALAGHCEESQVSQSIALLEQRLEKIRTPLTLAWGILGLAAWKRRPAFADQAISECLDRQARLGPYDTSHLALLLIAGHCPGGLIDLFPAKT